MSVEITIMKGKCQGGYHKIGDKFIVDHLAPPMRLGAWNAIAPYVTTLHCGGNFTWEKEQGMGIIHCPDPKGITLEIKRIP